MSRALVTAGAGTLLLTTAACATTAGPSGARDLGIGTTTPAGLQVVNPRCEYTSSEVVASGTMRSTDTQAPSAPVSITLFVLPDGAPNQTRTVTYPGPAMTGTDVPFRIAVAAPGGPGFACEVDFQWAGIG